MDLISREAVINIATSSCLDLDSYDDTDEFCDEVKEIPSAFEGMTNGEVVRAVFPEVVPMENEFNISFHSHDKDDFFNECTLDKVWWNAPYKAESEGKE